MIGDRDRRSLAGLRAFLDLSLAVMANQRAQIAAAPGFASLVAKLGAAVPPCSLCEHVYMLAVEEFFGDKAGSPVRATAALTRTRDTLFFLGRALDLPTTISVESLKPFALEQACLALHDCDIVLAVDHALALASIRQKVPWIYTSVERRFVTQMIAFIEFFEGELDDRTQVVFNAARTVLC